MTQITMNAGAKTVLSNVTETALQIAQRKLQTKMVTWRLDIADSIMDLKRTVLAEAVSLTEGESLTLSDTLQDLLAIKEGGMNTVSREWTADETRAYTLILNCLQRAALPFMLSVLLGKVSRFDSPEAALSAFWKESKNAVQCWLPRHSPTTFRWFMTETFKKRANRIAADEEGGRHRKEDILVFTALLKGFQEADEAANEHGEDVEILRFSQYNSLDAEAVLEKIALLYGGMYLEGVDINGEPKKNPAFWSQKFTTLQKVQSTIDDMQLLMNPLSLDYQVNEELGMLGETLEASQRTDEECRADAFSICLAALEEHEIDVNILQRYAHEIHEYLETLMNMDDEKKPVFLPVVQAHCGIPAQYVTPITAILAPFYAEYAGYL